MTREQVLLHGLIVIGLNFCLCEHIKLFGREELENRPDACIRMDVLSFALTAIFSKHTALPGRL